MEEFKHIQSQLQHAKRLRAESDKTVFLARERLKKLNREKGNAFRSHDENSDIIKNIKLQERELYAQISEAQNQFQIDWENEQKLWGAFKDFTDPKRYLSQFTNDIPILLFPVRLETRFKIVTTPDLGIKRQLWVRIFPDECSVDTFEDTLSEAEVILVRNYWSTVWSAGSSGNEDHQAIIKEKRKAAWRALAGNLQPGRAYWVTTQYKPLNEADLPPRTGEDEMILIIQAEDLPSQSEQQKLGDYWKKIWLANGNALLSQSARNQLNSDIGDEDRATELIANYRPFNLDDVEAPAENPPAVKVAFIHFRKIKDEDTRLASWSQPIKSTTLPDRFVLLGYKGKDGDGNPDKVMEELGEHIPDPLIMGPNPSADPDELLKADLIDSYQSLGTAELKAQRLNAWYNELTEHAKGEKPVEIFISEIVRLSGEELESALGEIYEGLKDEAKASMYIDYLCQKSETKWLFDFEEAVNMGMGFKVDLEQSVYENGFDRLFVIGIKLSADEMEAKTALEELIKHHHYGTSGFSILGQGTSTNNTETENSGFSESEDINDSFERYREEIEADDPDDFFEKKDGKWLAELLGIDAENASLPRVSNYFHTDQCESKAMNIALWNATAGYFMESMMSPVFSSWQHKVARRFFTHFVSGRGNVPAIRIGQQPYGILTTSSIKKLEWLKEGAVRPVSGFGDMEPVIQQMYTLFVEVCKQWQPLLEKVAYIGKEGDAHKILLKALGLHASSVEFYQRYAQSFAQYFNTLKLTGLGGALLKFLIEGTYKLQGIGLLESLGYAPGDEPIPILEKFFLTKFNPITGELIDDQPLSEKNPIRPYADPIAPDTESRNYIYWLIANALTDHDKIKKQEGFTDGPPPVLLYQMLRHSMDLEFSNTALDLYLNAQILDQNQIKIAKIDADFIGIQAQPTVLQSRYELLDRKETRITDGDISVGRHISKILADEQTQPLNITPRLTQMVAALDHLKDVPTARLERAFVEHLDMCSYRLDAWMLGFVNMQLHGMRYPLYDEGAPYRPGIYLGAYGWVEDLKPDHEILEPATLDPEMKAIFDPDDTQEVLTDSSNAGYVHAPSINQAITASVLRNAYVSEASKDKPDLYKINLSSERVRMALGVIEGLQQGQSLGALLGYQLERGLHDRYKEAEVDKFIYQLRIAFPLVSNQMEETSEKEEELESITQIEARNVVDGLKLVKHVNKTNNTSYPFGLTYLLDVDTEAQRTVINAEVERIRNINDALADISIAESVHQVVQANYERAAGTMDAFNKGESQQIPEVVLTPRSGTSLTNRVGIHFTPGLTAKSDASPRAKAEPAINDWLVYVLPPMTDICCKAVFRFPDYEEGMTKPDTPRIISMADLGLNPIDLLYLVDLEKDKNLTVLDDYMLNWIHRGLPAVSNSISEPRPDVEVEINYTHSIPDKITLFEIAPVINSLRSLILEARPLKNSDMQLTHEAKKSKETPAQIRLDNLNAALAQFNQNFINPAQPDSGLDIAHDSFTNLFVEEDFKATLANKQLIIDDIDGYIDLFIKRLKSLSQFGVAQSGFGFVFDRKAEIYKSIYQKVLDYKKRWDEKHEKFINLITVQLPNAALEERSAVLQEAERTISTSYSLPVPSDQDYLNILLNHKKPDFDKKLKEIKDFLDASFVNLKDLINEVEKLNTGNGTVLGKGLTEFDLLSLEKEEEERKIVVFAEDMITQAAGLDEAMINKAATIKNLMEASQAEAKPDNKLSLLTEVGKTLFGENFLLIPEFKLGLEQGNELKKSFDAKDQLLNYQQTELSVDFPVDNWLYSIARVREKMGHWENLAVLAEGYKNISLSLKPLQLPFKADDSWLGLSYPETYEIESDKLLYTAWMKGFAPADLQCGLLIDEWTEVIPAPKETTGLSFQYDQSNAEAPQSLLLLTPSSAPRVWNWEEVVNTLHETLDMARLRALEPAHIDQTHYAQFLPATVSAVTVHPLINMALNYAQVNGLPVQTNATENG